MSLFRRIADRVAPPGAEVASVALIFAALVLIAIAQIPAHLLIRSGFLSAGVAASQLVAIGGVPLLIIWRLRLRRQTLLPFSWPGAKLVAAVVVATAGAVLVIDYATAASERFIPLPARVEQDYVLLMASSGAAQIAIKLVVLCLLPALCEEIFFRGFCCTSLARAYGWPAGIAGSALLFAALHGNAWYLHLYFALGLFFGWIYWKSGTLWVPILAHALNNAWTYLNHLRGFAIPLDAPFGVADGALLAAGLALLFAGLVLVRRAAIARLARATPPPPRR